MIGSIHELNNVLNNVVNRALELAIENTTTGNWTISHDDVSELISEEDYLTYFDYIADEIMGREECLELDCADHELSITCGLAWCKNYIPLPDEDFEYGYRSFRPAPSLTHLADIGNATVKHLAHNNSMAMNPADLGITDSDIDYALSMANPDTFLSKERTHLQQLSVLNAPVTSMTYEELLCHSAQNQYAGLRPAIEWCINSFGQTIANEYTKKHYPIALEHLEKRFSLDPPASLRGYVGTLISGKPALMLSHIHSIDPLDTMNYSDRNIYHAQTEMMTSQLSEALSIYNNNISCIRGSVADSPDHVSNEIVAILPSETGRELRESFTRSFDYLLENMPFSLDPAWVKQQYDTALEYIQNDYKASHAHPVLVEEHASEIAIKACSFLGRRLGRLTDDWFRAQAAHDNNSLHELSSFCDFTKDRMTLEDFVDDAYHAVMIDLQTPIRMYSKPPSQHAAFDDSCFLLRKGELLSLMREFQIDQTVPSFLASYSYDLATDMRQALAEKQVSARKNGLSAKIQDAEQKKSIQKEGRHEREEGHCDALKDTHDRA